MDQSTKENQALRMQVFDPYHLKYSFTFHKDDNFKNSKVPGNRITVLVVEVTGVEV